MADVQQQLLADEAHAASLAASAEEGHDYGAVFTRRWVVELILDLVGYSPTADLAVQRAIEPACGAGAFLGPMVERLSRSCRHYGRRISEAAQAIRACDLQPRHVAESRWVVEERLVADGWDRADARRLAEGWVTHEDFLLGGHEFGSADYVIGNPPYIRLEAVSEARSAGYRRACATMGGRADVYVGFFEVGLNSLRSGGGLGFICADRWMRNQYGQRLRRMVTRDFSVETVIEMHDVDAFEDEVSAYPSITVLRRASQGPAVVATAKRGFDEAGARRIRLWASQKGGVRLSDPTCEAARLPTWFSDVASWPSGRPSGLQLWLGLSVTCLRWRTVRRVPASASAWRAAPIACSSRPTRRLSRRIAWCRLQWHATPSVASCAGRAAILSIRGKETPVRSFRSRTTQG
jgi:hypothetical protein